ncbi:MAG: hypothetical protein HYX69_23005 [Planctomycetia bacterium]|nr:hypothetical protein [Planctomycetia bacterium]
MIKQHRYWRWPGLRIIDSLQRLVPEIRAEHLVAAPAGVRAQALARDGSLVDDFLIQEHLRVITSATPPRRPPRPASISAT